MVDPRRPCRPAQLEVGVIENVERFCAELQTEPVGKLEVLEDGSIHCPVSGPHKSVATQIAHATQAGCSKESVRKIESVGPLGVRRIHMVRDRIRTVIRHAVQVVVRAHIDTMGRIKGGRIASPRSFSSKRGWVKAPSRNGDQWAPLWNDQIPFHCHPPRTVPSAP